MWLLVASLIVSSRDTAAREAEWIAAHLPAVLMEAGPRGLLRWQWLGVVLMVVAAVLLGRAMSWLTRSALSQLTRRTKTPWDDMALQRTGGPLTLIWGLATAYALVPSLLLPASAKARLVQLIAIGFSVCVFWVLSRATDVAGQMVIELSWSKDRPAARALAPLGRRVAKTAIFAMALVAVLSQLGYPVASLIAGLGIGGLALALAAQKTVENLFGAFSIGVDQPFREGDLVRVDDFTGTVESIGLRSTRFRTAERTLITIPNGKLAEMRIESFAPRDRLRIGFDLPLGYRSSPSQVRAVVQGIERLLTLHPKVVSGSVVVRLKQLGAASLDIEIGAYFATTDLNEFTLLKQDVLLAILEVVEGAGTTLAFPAQTIHVARDA